MNTDIRNGNFGYRKPRTANELRAIELAEDFGIKVRAKRGKHGLANSYDDKPVGKTKRQRYRKQWQKNLAA